MHRVTSGHAPAVPSICRVREQVVLGQTYRPHHQVPCRPGVVATWSRPPTGILAVTGARAPVWSGCFVFSDALQMAEIGSSSGCYVHGPLED